MTAKTNAKTNALSAVQIAARDFAIADARVEGELLAVSFALASVILDTGAKVTPADFRNANGNLSEASAKNYASRFNAVLRAGPLTKGGKAKTLKALEKATTRAALLDMISALVDKAGAKTGAGAAKGAASNRAKGAAKAKGADTVQAAPTAQAAKVEANAAKLDAHAATVAKSPKAPALQAIASEAAAAAAAFATAAKRDGDAVLAAMLADHAAQLVRYVNAVKAAAM